MLPGFRGHLFSEFFIEQHLAAEAPDTPQHRRTRQSLIAGGRLCASLGPTSSLRAVLEQGAEPLAAALGFTVAGRRHLGDDLVSATLSAGGPPVAILVTGWGRPLEPLWGDAVVESRRRGASWCLLMNGTAVRLIEIGRAHV